MDVFDDTGRRLSLRATGKAGGEGAIYEIDGNPRSVAKIYHPQRADAEQHDKVRAMAATPPVDPAWEARRHRSIAWAQRVLFHDAARTRFAGFTMPRIDTNVFGESHALFDPQDRVRRFGGSFTWRHLMTAACNLASSVAAVHAEGHRVGDLRETNVLVAPSALICLIDCDSFQIRDPATDRVFGTRVASGEYLPAELQGVDRLDEHDRTHADAFALGVLVFKFLMSGVHPFQARGRAVADAPSTEAKIAKGAFPYGRRLGVEPPAFALPYDILPPALRALFKRCFVDGHRKPRRRPSPDEWFAALRAESKRLKTCRTNPNHWFGRHLRRCPWCRMAEDPFPAPGAAPTTQMTARAAVPKPAPPKPEPTPERHLVRRMWRAARRVRVTPRRALLALTLTALTVAAFTPLGHAESPPRVQRLGLEATRRGPCPFDGARTLPPDWCRGRWTIEGAKRIERRTRTLFILARTDRTLRIDYTVRFAARDGRRCELPWIDNLALERDRPAVCLADCPQRIELRRANITMPLVAAGGVGARDGPLRCGVPYTGSWTFDIADARGPVTLHHPGIAPIRLEV